MSLVSLISYLFPPQKESIRKYDGKSESRENTKDYTEINKEKRIRAAMPVNALLSKLLRADMSNPRLFPNAHPNSKVANIIVHDCLTLHL